MFSSIIVSGQKNGNRPAKNRSYLCKVMALFINLHQRRRDLEYSVSVIPVCFLNTEEK